MVSHYYRYDGQHRHIAKLTPNGGNWDRTDYYHGDNWQILEERAGTVANLTTAASTPRVQWIWDTQYIDTPICRLRDTANNGTWAETLYYTTDANMNVTALLDTSGNVVERTVYDAYGKPTFYAGSSFATPSSTSAYANEVLFAGYRYNALLGIYEVRYRVYDPVTGRWLQRDPGPEGILISGPTPAEDEQIVVDEQDINDMLYSYGPTVTPLQVGQTGLGEQYVDGMSLYQHVRSNPTRFTDPMGLQVQWPQQACLNYFKGKAFDEAAENKNAAERIVTRFQGILNYGNIDQERKDVVRKALRNARQVAAKADSMYKFFRYMQRYGCQCTEMRNSMRGMGADESFDTLATALKAGRALANKIGRVGIRVMPMGDLTGALGVYDDAAKAISEITFMDSLKLAVQYGDISGCANCPKLDVKNPGDGWSGVVDDWGKLLP